MTRSIANYYLGGIFIGHHDCWDRELTALSIGMVGCERFLRHANVVVITQTVGRPFKLCYYQFKLTLTS